MNRRRLLLLLALVVTAGCGGNTATLSGKVTYKGRTVTSGTVVVRNPDDTAVKGIIQPDGKYTVKGVGRGRVKVGVFSADPSLNPSGDKTKPAGWFPLPRTLGNPGTSGLECEVTSSRTSFDVDVK